jgi:hypothetical protein
MMPEYLLEIITEPTGDALNEGTRQAVIERFGEASAGFSPNGHLGIRIRELSASGAEEALRTGLEIFHDVTDGMGLRLRKITIGPPHEFDD